MKIFTYIIILTVAIAIIAGFFIVGSPQEERLRRFDQQKVADMQTIQWQIVNYWQRKGTLPARLEDLTDSISGFLAPKDPQTGENYGYETRSSLAFVLCANFSMSSPGSSQKENEESVIGRREESGESYKLDGGNWEYRKGKTCFKRKVY